MATDKRQFGFDEALIHMRTEKKVTREAWKITAPAPICLYLSHGEIYAKLFMTSDAYLETIEVEDILADDWMIYDQ